MTDHADTIRPYLWNTIPGQWPPVRIDAAHESLDALLAERQQAIDERDAWKLKAKELDDRNKWRWPHERARCEQAIDALREINAIENALTSGVAGRMQFIANAALLSLGEQP